ncbi:transcriptional regulator CecR [Desulfuromonas carbonis]|uniref:CerR family C-terminal domain-containing protein n=1 Tax=Desulfuromonas sp. DDH964 TaxID=1823759 RepID=UPI00078EA8E1|nr:CerR family C-terminal domain-containing protein [Desulfuromonas sp. DDH964]AMV70961.1 TetR family transcriptional regulator [Desulfuromonas sp. DDH964]
MQKKINSGGPPKEDPAHTRDRLLEAGLEVFGEYGYGGATTRLLAERARVNLAAIPYHFGGKEGLYQAVVTQIAGRVRQRLDPLLAEIGSARRSGATDAAAALVLLERLLAALVEFIVGTPEAARFSHIVLREQLSPSAAYAIVFERIMQPLMEALAALVAAAGGGTVVGPWQRLQAMTLLGQVLVFRFGRETAVRGLGMSGYSAEETAAIRDVVLAHTRAIVTSAVVPPGQAEGEQA